MITNFKLWPFINAKDPKIAEEMLEEIYQKLSEKVTIKLGSFGSMMQVGLINDGPSTFVLSSKDGKINYEKGKA